MTGQKLLEVRGVTKRFGGFSALSSVDLHVNEHERFGLIGPNGSGKTTLINCISGALANDEGAIVFSGQDITATPAYKRTRLGISRSFQIPKPFVSMSIIENLCIPLEYAAHQHAHGENLRGEAMDILQVMGLADKADVRTGGLTQIELRKLELARAMAAKPRLLISDEAMAGLSNSEVDDILDILVRLNGEGLTIIMIEHIMRAVMSFSERIVVLDAGEKIAEGVPEEIINNKDVERAYLGA